jgi:hypothetical protein
MKQRNKFKWQTRLSLLWAPLLMIGLQSCVTIRTDPYEQDHQVKNSALLQSLIGGEDAVEAETVSDLSKLVKVRRKISSSPAIAQEQEESNAEEIQQTISPPKQRRASSGRVVEYTVKKTDTLMKIAYAAFSDPLRWKEIYEANRAKLHGKNRLKEGTVLTLSGADFDAQQPDGSPYLIRLRDTLGKISSRVYGSTFQWKSIWKNNPSLIRDPNLIYAGFTLYYLPKKSVP